MKIKIDEITEEGLSLDLSEDGKTLSALAGGLDFSFKAPVKAHLDITAVFEKVRVAGGISAPMGLTCSRCLKPFDYDLKSDFILYFLREKVAEREKELTPDEMEINYIEGSELDTDEILLGQIALDVPMQPLCSPDCRGLCQKCGADLNQGACGCKGEEKIDSRFARLKDFKVR